MSMGITKSLLVEFVVYRLIHTVLSLKFQYQVFVFMGIELEIKTPSRVD